jgi:hypothetical protein
MVSPTLHTIFLALVIAIVPTLAIDFKVKTFKMDLDDSRLLSLARNTRLPIQPEYPGLGSTLGIDLDALRMLQKNWVTKYDWDAEQQRLNE